MITPTPFDGNTLWDDYQVQFELISELNGWNKKVMAIYLAASLSGCTRAVLTDLDERSRKDYFTLKEALPLRFGNGGKSEFYRAQLRNHVKGRDETLPELAQAIQRLVRQAHPEASPSVREVIERDHFVDAILDTEIQWKVLQTRPRTVQEALAVAIEVEALQASEKQCQRQGHFTTNIIATQVAETHQETFDSSISKILAEMKKDHEEQRHLLEGLMKKMTSPERWQNMGVWGPNRVGGGKCWNCSQPGHFSLNCPFQETNKLQERARERAKPRGLSSVTPCHQRPACPPSTRTLRGTHYQLGLYVSSKVEGVGVRFLGETGSNITILSPAVVAKIAPDRQPSLESVENHMIHVDGSAKPFRGRGTFELEIEGQRIRQEIWIVDIELEGILGMDFGASTVYP